jgi:hypothetical protein
MPFDMQSGSGLADACKPQAKYLNWFIVIEDVILLMCFRFDSMVYIRHFVENVDLLFPGQLY